MRGLKKDFFKQELKLLVLIALMLALFALISVKYFSSEEVVDLPTSQQKTTVKKESKNTDFEPKLNIQEILSGLSHPWDMVFLPDGTMVFNERNGTISSLENGQKKVITKINDVYAIGEGGLTGLALDVEFTNNRFIYTCMNARTASGIDVRLVRWKLSEDKSSLTDRSDIVTGIPSNRSGRHSGCRVRAASDGTLWIGTGDSAVASNPQDPKSLGGKILHVTRDGMPAGTGLPAPFDPRIFSYGHRNVQGLVIFEKPINDVYGYSIEHGSDRDDEINLLKKGNFGWAPRITYVERGIPMTDTGRFPDAISAVWSSGYPTIAPSGASQLKSENWGRWNGAIAMAVLKGKQVRIMHFDQNNSLIEEKSVLTDFGRVRSTVLGPDGNLYISTDNGSNDKIIKITPSE